MLSSLSLCGQINVGIEVLCYTRSMFPVSYLGVHCSFLISLFLPYWLLAWRLLSPLGKKAGEWALVSSFMPGCRPYACLSVPSLAGHRRRRNVRFCQNHVPLSCHGIVCSFLNHLHPALLATRLSASQLLELKGWSVAMVMLHAWLSHSH